MAIGVVGRKAGMTRIFTDEGQALPVTVIEVEPNRITQLKTLESDGYRAVQVTVGSRRSSRVNKAAAGHFAKAGVEAGRVSSDGDALHNWFVRGRHGRRLQSRLVHYRRLHARQRHVCRPLCHHVRHTRMGPDAQCRQARFGAAGSDAV